MSQLALDASVGASDSEPWESSGLAATRFLLAQKMLCSACLPGLTGFPKQPSEESRSKVDVDASRFHADLARIRTVLRGVMAVLVIVVLPHLLHTYGCASGECHFLCI